METSQVMDVSLRAGEILICSGAEIYRVEDTITRICRSYGVSSESFVLPTGMFVSCGGTGRETVTRVKRIRDRTVDMRRIELVNAFSRSLVQKPLNYEEAMAELDRIEKTPGFRFVPRLLVAGITALAYTLLFKGNIVEGLVALCISMLVYSFRELVLRRGFFQFFEFFMAGLLTGIFSFLAVRYLPAVFSSGFLQLFPGMRRWPELSIYRIITGALVIFLPGIAITNSIRDALYGDTVSSLNRLVEAVYIITALGAGVGIAVTLGVMWL